MAGRSNSDPRAVAILPVDAIGHDEALAVGRELGSAGFAVIVVGHGSELGATTRALADAGTRVAAFEGSLTSSDTRDALREMVVELFPADVP